jgi:hypothetical protein
VQQILIHAIQITYYQERFQIVPDQCISSAIRSNNRKIDLSYNVAGQITV